MTVTDTEFEGIVRHYHKPDYRQITDYKKVVENKTTTNLEGDTIYVFEPPAQTVYLGEDGYPVDIGPQRVSIENNAYYYKWNNDPEVEEDLAFEYVAPYEWKRTSLPHLEIDEEED